MPIHQLVYTSTATTPFTQPQLQHLLRQARSTNANLWVTGVLLYCDGKFVQVLEGDDQAVWTVYGRIQRDLRHTNLELLADGPVPERVFPDWAMGFLPVPSADFGKLTGYLNTDSPRYLLGRAHHADPELLALLREFVTTQAVDY